MKTVIEINDKEGRCFFGKDRSRLIVEVALKNARMKEAFKDKTVGVELAFVSADEIAGINEKYRGKEGPTDVLSFANYESKDKILKEKKEDIYLGEIILCCEDIEDYCRQEGIVFEKELYKVISHGVLHLAGFIHGKKMFAIQEKTAKEILSYLSDGRQGVENDSGLMSR